MVSFESKSYSKRLLHLISWSHWFTFFNVLIAILLSSFYVFGEKTPDTLIGHFYLYITWASHMGFLTFIGFLLIIFPIILIYPRTQFIRVTSSLVFTASLVLLLLDAFVYKRLGYHLNASSSDQIILLISNLISHNTLKFWLITTSTAFILLIIELTLSNYAWKHLKDLQRMPYAKYVVRVLVASFFVSHFTHIWADARWNYDVLKQDTVLPLSYPTTAKTLLTKYELFDANDYTENKESALSIKHKVSSYPVLTEQCNVLEPAEQSVYMVLTETALTENKIEAFALKSSGSTIDLARHINNALPSDSWFNLLYSLPSIYKDKIAEQNVKPLLLQEMELRNIAANLTVITKDGVIPDSIWFSQWLNTSSVTEVSSLIFSEQEALEKTDFTDNLNKPKAGLHILYFDADNSAQAELYIDALLVAQREKDTKDIIWVSSMGNKNIQDSLAIKPSLLIVPGQASNKLKRLTSHMDIQPTLLSQWLKCDGLASTIVNGQDILTVKSNRVIANTIDTGIIVFKKDKSVFIDNNGEFQSYSRQLKMPISVNADFPLMIDGVNFIKRFNESTDKATVTETTN